jgi:hypothetical protein
MAQSELSVDKTYRMPVKLVGTEGQDLQLEGFMLVPESRLILFERIAVAARNYMAARIEFPSNPSRVNRTVDALEAGLTELRKIWDIPPSSEPPHLPVPKNRKRAFDRNPPIPPIRGVMRLLIALLFLILAAGQSVTAEPVKTVQVRFHTCARMEWRFRHTQERRPARASTTAVLFRTGFFPRILPIQRFPSTLERFGTVTVARFSLAGRITVMVPIGHNSRRRKRCRKYKPSHQALRT